MRLNNSVRFIDAFQSLGNWNAYSWFKRQHHNSFCVPRHLLCFKETVHYRRNPVWLERSLQDLPDHLLLRVLLLYRHGPQADLRRQNPVSNFKSERILHQGPPRLHVFLSRHFHRADWTVLLHLRLRIPVRVLSVPLHSQRPPPQQQRLFLHDLLALRQPKLHIICNSEFYSAVADGFCVRMPVLL